MKTLLDVLDSRYSELDRRSRLLIESTADTDLYRKPRVLPQTFAMFSVGEYVLRSAAAVEQASGGLTTRLWDDPFEWTLPEKLASTGMVLDYLREVEVTRRKGFAFLKDDTDLGKKIPAPRDLKTVFEILVSTLSTAQHFQGRAFAIFQMFSDIKLPRI
jgi:hypothetical protein